jgi:molecular chaperone GrpE (heat shock protein)
MSDDKRSGGPPSFDPVTRLNALDLALRSQQLELDEMERIRRWLPLLDQIESVCRDFEHLDGDERARRAEGVAVIAELAEQAAGGCELERFGSVGERSLAERHEVIDTRPGQPADQGRIIEIRAPGWSFRGRVVRRAKVVTSVLVPGESEAKGRTWERR